MYWLIDVVAVILLLAAIWYGFNRGLVKLASGAGIVILRVVCVAAGAFLFLAIMQSVGIVDALTNSLANMFGQTEKFAIASVAEKLTSWQNILATLICLIPAVILSMLIFWVAFHYLEKLVEKIELKGNLALVDKILGIVIIVILFFVIYALILAVIGAFAYNGVMLYLDEMLRACPLTGLIYKHNAFLGAFKDMGVIVWISQHIAG